MDIARETRESSVAMTTVLGTTPLIDFRGCVAGELHLPATAATTLTWYSCMTDNGTFVAAYDSAGAAVTQTVSQSRAYPIPTALAGCKFLKCVVDAAVTIGVTMKT